MYRFHFPCTSIRSVVTLFRVVLLQAPLLTTQSIDQVNQSFLSYFPTLTHDFDRGILPFVSGNITVSDEAIDDRCCCLQSFSQTIAFFHHPFSLLIRL
jgi:hypothetical protein